MPGLFTELPRETVRKVPMGSELKPHKSTKRSKKPNLVALGIKNVGFSGYSRPFSDSFCAGLWNKLSSSYDAYCCNITASCCRVGASSGLTRV
jgi:hypothetical protein